MHTFVIVDVISPTTVVHMFAIVDVAIPTTLGSISASDNSISVIGSNISVSEMIIKMCDTIFITNGINTVFAQ